MEYNWDINNVLNYKAIFKRKASAISKILSKILGIGYWKKKTKILIRKNLL